MARNRNRQRCPAIDIAGLPDLDLDALRRLWTLLYGSEPLPRISRELLVRAIAHRLQEERQGGGLLAREEQLLDRLADELEARGQIALPAAPTLKAGLRLVREWQGTLHEVIVLEKGYLWKGRTHRSLSGIARTITGAHWSGPRFFGLREARAR